MQAIEDSVFESGHRNILVRNSQIDLKGCIFTNSYNAGVLFTQRSLWPRDQGDAVCLGGVGIDPDGCYAVGTLADGLGAALCAWLLYLGCADGNLYAGLVFYRNGTRAGGFRRVFFIALVEVFSYNRNVVIIDDRKGK